MYKILCNKSNHPGPFTNTKYIEHPTHIISDPLCGNAIQTATTLLSTGSSCSQSLVSPSSIVTTASLVIGHVLGRRRELGIRFDDFIDRIPEVLLGSDLDKRFYKGETPGKTSL